LSIVKQQKQDNLLQAFNSKKQRNKYHIKEQEQGTRAS